eukprot:maker-scaffold226_size249562-snap-gene-0.12 protein:Tk02726 transcript:maker-scaffold226_size249562-snap-gene-0.12-mRNA-1 annotation:"hypothetical protein CAPTEDRAFT_103335"
MNLLYAHQPYQRRRRVDQMSKSRPSGLSPRRLLSPSIHGITLEAMGFLTQGEDTCRGQHRSIPVTIDDDIQMLLVKNGDCPACTPPSVEPDEDLRHKLDQEEARYLKRIRGMTKDVLAASLMVELKDLVMSHMSCATCRKKVLDMAVDLALHRPQAMFPVVFSQQGDRTADYISIDASHIDMPSTVANLLTRSFHNQWNQCGTFRSSKGHMSRCNLHGIPSKTVCFGTSWLDIWDAMVEPCRQQMLSFKFDRVEREIRNYTQRHDFCANCKSNIEEAFSYLIEFCCDKATRAKFVAEGKVAGTVDESSQEDEQLFMDISLELNAAKEVILVINYSDDDITDLMDRAEIELTNQHIDRHAKTIEAGEREILSVIGMLLHARFVQAIRNVANDSNCYDSLYALALEALKTRMEVVFETHFGLLEDELIVELQCEENQKEAKAAKKREKKQRQKQRQKELKAEAVPTEPNSARSSPTPESPEPPQAPEVPSVVATQAPVEAEPATVQDAPALPKTADQPPQDAKPPQDAREGKPAKGGKPLKETKPCPSPKVRTPPAPKEKASKKRLRRLRKDDEDDAPVVQDENAEPIVETTTTPSSPKWVFRSKPANLPDLLEIINVWNKDADVDTMQYMVQGNERIPSEDELSIPESEIQSYRNNKHTIDEMRKKIRNTLNANYTRKFGSLQENHIREIREFSAMRRKKLHSKTLNAKTGH